VLADDVPEPADREAGFEHAANLVDQRLVGAKPLPGQVEQRQRDEDPVAGVRFPRFAAAASRELGGKTYYFIGEETRREFEAKHGAAPK